MAGKPLPIQPHILEAPTVEDAVTDDGQPLDPRMPAGGAAGVEDDRARRIAGEASLDLPDQFPALFRVGCARL